MRRLAFLPTRLEFNVCAPRRRQQCHSVYNKDYMIQLKFFIKNVFWSLLKIFDSNVLTSFAEQRLQLVT